jgi:hypothetical protein
MFSGSAKFPAPGENFPALSLLGAKNSLLERAVTPKPGEPDVSPGDGDG